MNELTELANNQLLEVLGAQSLEVKKWDEIVTADTISYPLADFSALGTAFSGISAAFTMAGQAAVTGEKTICSCCSAGM